MINAPKILFPTPTFLLPEETSWHKINGWLRSKISFLWAYRSFFWQLSRDGNLHGLCLSCAISASPNPSSTVLFRVGYAMVGRGNAGWTMSKSGHPCLCCIRLELWKMVSVELSSMPSDHPSCQGTELTSPYYIIPHAQHHCHHPFAFFVVEETWV